MSQSCLQVDRDVRRGSREAREGEGRLGQGGLSSHSSALEIVGVAVLHKI